MIALVTGSNRGIGLAVAKGLLTLGHAVIITSRQSEDGQKALAALTGDVHWHALDVTSDASVDTLKTYVQKRFGRLDILINNAAINYDAWHSSSNADLHEVAHTIDTNLMGAWRVTQAFVPMMKAHQFGRIINVSSGAGALTSMGDAAPGYSVSKAALNALTRQLAAELAHSNIVVNSVCPGWVRTDMGGANAPRTPEEGAKGIIWAATQKENSPNGLFLRDGEVIAW